VIGQRSVAPGILSKGSFTPWEVVASVLDGSGLTGAVVSFVGVVKTPGKDGKSVKKVIIEAYREAADPVLKRICDELVEKYSLNRAVICHYTGEFMVGEPLVVVTIASKSRYEAYRALEEAVERYKKEPPIWKKEVYEDGSSAWIAD
jgi:molybdopterin synthase catalytic subunit